MFHFGPITRKAQECGGTHAGGMWTSDRHDGRVSFRAALVWDVTVTGAFRLFRAAGSVFDACDFDSFRPLAGTLSNWPPTVYRRCRFREADLRRVEPGFARFVDCLFTDVRLDGWKASNAEFLGCTFEGRIGDVVFFGRKDARGRWLSRRPSNDVLENDFTRASLRGVDFRHGVPLERQSLPDDRHLFVIPDAARAADRVTRSAGKLMGARDRLAAGALQDLLRFGRDDGDAMLYRRGTIPWATSSVEAQLLAAAGAIPARLFRTASS